MITEIHSPNFLCIGAQKAGTTWLYRNLKQHPDVWLPPLKEILYFNRPSSLPTITRLLSPRDRVYRRWVFQGMMKRIRSLKTQDLPGKRQAADRLSAGSSAILPHAIPGCREHLQHIRWYLRYFLLPRSDPWYTSLFWPAKGRMTGDFSPYYANLPAEQVAHIHDLLPHASIIYLLRNPIDRAWSSFWMYSQFRGEHPTLPLCEKRIPQHLENICRSTVSNYVQNLETWEAYYSQDHIYVGFFDTLYHEPQQFFQDIMGFLGLNAHIPTSVTRKENGGSYPPIPDHIAAYLAYFYSPQLKRLHQKFSNEYTASWIDEVRQYLRVQ